MKRIGGTTRAIRRLTGWNVILTIFFIVLGCINYPRIKANYTKLHKEVSTLRAEYDKHIKLFHTEHGGNPGD